MSLVKNYIKKMSHVCRSGSNYIQIEWLVSQNKEDIADFVIFSSDDKLKERISYKLVHYNSRSLTIRNDFVKVKYQISNIITLISYNKHIITQLFYCFRIQQIYVYNQKIVLVMTDK